MSQIEDARSEIENLKISMDNAIVIHALNNLDSQFRLYLTILNHEARQKAQLPTLSELTKILEDEELRLKNESTTSANFAKRLNQSRQVTETVQIPVRNWLKIWIRKKRFARHMVVITMVTIDIWQQSVFSVMKPAISEQTALKIKRRSGRLPLVPQITSLRQAKIRLQKAKLRRWIAFLERSCPGTNRNKR